MDREIRITPKGKVIFEIVERTYKESMTKFEFHEALSMAWEKAITIERKTILRHAHQELKDMTQIRDSRQS